MFRDSGPVGEFGFEATGTLTSARRQRKYCCGTSQPNAADRANSPVRLLRGPPGRRAASGPAPAQSRPRAGVPGFARPAVGGKGGDRVGVLEPPGIRRSRAEPAAEPRLSAPAPWIGGLLHRVSGGAIEAGFA